MQHDARILSENATHTVVSIFNNGRNDEEIWQEASSAMHLVIDHRLQVARSLLQFESPGDKSLAATSQGSKSYEDDTRAVVFVLTNSLITNCYQTATCL